MNAYHINEGFFLTLPPNWEDETTQVLGWQLKDSSPFSLTINRVVLQHQEDLKTYITQQLKTLEQDLNGYQLLAHQTTQRIEGFETAEIEFTWISDGDTMAQRQAYVLYQDQVLAFTATMMEQFTPEGIKRWETLLSQFRFRKDRNPLKLKHAFKQSRLQSVLERHLKTGNVLQKVAIQTTDGATVADVVWVSEQRAKIILEDEIAAIAPEICIEIISVGNTEAEIDHRKQLYFAAGAEEVWIYHDKEDKMLFYNQQQQLKQSLRVADFPLTLLS